jgi:NTE family protein
LAGSSAGAIVAAMRVAGYTPQEMKKILDDTDYRKFKDGNGFGLKSYNVLRHKGLYKGDFFYNYIKELLLAKGVTVFGDVKDSLKVLTSDISNGRLVIWPDDGAVYDLPPDFIEVAWAVRCSMSIPFFFRPVRLGTNNGDLYFVDGGMLSNFPIWLFDSQEPRYPTFGLLLKEENQDQAAKISRRLHTYFAALISTMMKASDKRSIRPEEYHYRTIEIPVWNVSSIDFEIQGATKQQLFDSGYQAATKFLENWTWEEYLTWAKNGRR